jgi:hypothetical protein
MGTYPGHYGIYMYMYVTTVIHIFMCVYVCAQYVYKWLIIEAACVLISVHATLKI